jgi:hypothetical protein
MGYAASSRVRLYGEDFEALSDPFPEDGGISVHVSAAASRNRSARCKRTPNPRFLAPTSPPTISHGPSDVAMRSPQIVKAE